MTTNPPLLFASATPCIAHAPAVSLPSPRVGFGVNYSISAQAFDEFTAPISKLLRQIAVETGAQIIDPLPYLSVKGMCPATVNGVPIYKDDNHLRSGYVRRHMIFIDSLYVE